MSIASRARNEKRATSATWRGAVIGTPARGYVLGGSGGLVRKHPKPVRHVYGSRWPVPAAKFREQILEGI